MRNDSGREKKADGAGTAIETENTTQSDKQNEKIRSLSTTRRRGDDGGLVCSLGIGTGGEGAVIRKKQGSKKKKTNL